MSEIDEMKQELLATKERLERALTRIGSAIARLEAIKEEAETVTLRIQYETEREDTITIPQSKLCHMQMGIPTLNTSEEIWAVATRSGGSLAQKAFVLNDEYDWELGRDSEARLCLVPIKKDKEK
jgi:hypothetical protein